jgi:magnesium-transporting ATPase (P-type)
MSTIVKDYEGNSGNCVMLKGAPERVIAKCSHYLNSHNVKKTLTENDKS